MRSPQDPRGVQALWRDRDGASAVLIALSLTVLMGFAGLAVDVGLWYADKRNAQGAADAAAYSAAIDYGSGDTVAGATAAAKAITAQYGLTNGSGGVTVTVNSPPTAGPNTSTSGAIEVIVTKTESLFFSSFFISAATVKARAVAIAGSTGGKYCVMALDKSSSITTASFGNGASVDMSVCGIQVNGSNSAAMLVTGGASVRANTVSVAGNYLLNNGGSLTANTINIHAPVLADPYAGVAVPTVGACNYNNASYSSGGSTYTISPGVYCNGLSIANGVRVTMNPGVYIINGGQFSLQGGTTTTATSGVTIVLTGSGSSYATANIANGVTFNLTAPSTGAMAGLAIFQDRAAPNSGVTFIAGGANMNVTGALYFPSQTVNYSNGSSTTSNCTQLIAYDLQFTGGAKFNNTCGGTGVVGIGAAATALSE